MEIRDCVAGYFCDCRRCRRDRGCPGLADPAFRSPNAKRSSNLFSISKLVAVSNIDRNFCLRFAFRICVGQFEAPNRENSGVHTAFCCSLIYVVRASESFRMDVQSACQNIICSRVASRLCGRRRYGARGQDRRRRRGLSGSSDGISPHCSGRCRRNADHDYLLNAMPHRRRVAVHREWTRAAFSSGGDQ